MVCRVAPSSASTRRRGVTGDQETQTQEVADYETALDTAGYGRFSRTALCACAGAFFTTGVQNCVMSYVLPAAKCELSLTTYQSGLVNMAFMLGGVASAFFWGITGDVVGRRNVLSFTLLLDSIIMLAQSFVSDYRLLLAARSINGFLIGGPSTLTFTYLSDLVGAKRRQLYLNVVGMSFVAAWLILPALAWMVIPIKSDHPTLLPVYSWRLYLALGSIPGFISGLWVLFLPESPRLLADTNRSDRALKILGSIHRANCGQKSDYMIRKLTMDDVFVVKSLDEEQSRTKELFVGVIKDLKMFVSKSYAVKSSLILFVFFANMAAGFGLNLWIPELLLRMQGRDCSSTAKTARLFQEVNNTAWRDVSLTYQTTGGKVNHSVYEEFGSGEEKCNADIDDVVFTSGLIVGAICVLGNAACAFLCSRGGGRGVRRAAAACALACAAACAVLAACVCSCTTSNKVAVAAAAVLNAASLNGNVLLIRLLLHALPAKLSGLGVCWGAWWGRAGGVASNMAVGVLLDYSCPAPFLSVAAFLAVSIVGIMLIQLEKTKEESSVSELRTDQESQEKTGTLDRYISTHM